MILTKLENYRLCHSGGYGNRVRQWQSLAEYTESGYQEPVALRVALAAGGGPSRFGVARDQVAQVVEEWAMEGIPYDRIRVAEMADKPRILQGEYRNSIGNGLYPAPGDLAESMLYTFNSGPMPIALKADREAGTVKNASGLLARLLIKNAMTTASYEDWIVLLDRYPNHVLEFSVWDECLGDMPNRNTIVWEVRRY